MSRAAVLSVLAAFVVFVLLWQVIVDRQRAAAVHPAAAVRRR